MDRLLAAFGLQEQELSHDDAGHHVVDGSHQANDPVLQQPGVDVVGSLATSGLLDDDRDEAAVDIVEAPLRIPAGQNVGQTLGRRFLLPEQRRDSLSQLLSHGERHLEQM